MNGYVFLNDLTSYEKAIKCEPGLPRIFIEIFATG